MDFWILWDVGIEKSGWNRFVDDLGVGDLGIL